MANEQTFPGVYTQIIDKSFVQTATSPFKPGLVGVASKGPFNVPIAVSSLKDFVRQCGKPVPATYNPDVSTEHGYFLADAVAVLADQTDTIQVVRVGNQFTNLCKASGSNPSGGTTIITASDQSAFLTPGTYVRVAEAGKNSTCGDTVTVKAVTYGTRVELNTNLLATYTSSADIAYCPYASAANEAEGFLYQYTYGAVVTSAGTIVPAASSGNKGDFSFVVSGTTTGLTVGDVLLIRETDNSGADTSAPTHEVRVKALNHALKTVYLETSNVTRIGYQALPLQATYSNGKLYKATASTRSIFMMIKAASAGTWANGSDTGTGVFVKVRPGSTAGTKRLEVYSDGDLVEVFDNLSSNPSSVNWYTTRVNDVSQYITIAYIDDSGGKHPANSVEAWDSTYQTYASGGMPYGNINAGGSSGGNCYLGQDGLNPQESDFVGTIMPDDDSETGIKILLDKDNLRVNFIAAPMDNVPITVMQELARVAEQANSMAFADVESGISARQAIDWHRGLGVYNSRGTVNNRNLACFWNWLTYTSPFTGTAKMVPPSLAALYAHAVTFNRDKRWYAAAGVNRGSIPWASGVQYTRIPEDVKNAMYGNGNSVNPITLVQGSILVWGNRTMQIAESKLTAISNMNLTNYIVTGMGDIGRRFVFEPNDPDLMVRLKLAFDQFMQEIKDGHGVEQFQLLLDNNPAYRNQRKAVVNLGFIATDPMERLFINATVYESGNAVLNSVG